MPNQPSITPELLAAAETFFGVAYTPAERRLMLDNFAEQIERAVLRRAMALPEDMGPATKFDPRLPGFAMPVATGFDWAPGDMDLASDDEAIAFAPVSVLAAWVKAGMITSVRLTGIYLERIARLNGRLLCYAIVLGDSALAEAEAMDALTAQGVWLGPLHGIPYGMKDILDTAGVETAWGAEPYRGRVPADDAHVVAALRAAGAVLLGKTSVGALAYGDIWYGGRTRNPWNLGEGSSGSSAGSACAVGAGLAGFAVGTETLGSIVSPATRCGVVGLRPTYGRISRRGAMALCWSLDKIGPICRGVTDAALVLAAMNGVDERDAFQIAAPFGFKAARGVKGLRVGYFAEDFAAEDVLGLEREALEAVRGLGVELVALKRRERPFEALMAILFAEAAAAFEGLTLGGDDDKLTWQDADAWPNSFRKARFLSAVDHVQADRLRRVVMEDMAEVFSRVDVVVGPSLAGPMMVITNFTGHPCLCLPAGLFESPTRAPVSLARAVGPAADGERFLVPHSVCLYGRLFDEDRLLAMGEALERVLAFSRRPPAPPGI